MFLSREFQNRSDFATLSWGLFLVLALSAVFIAAGFPLGPTVLIGCLCAAILAIRSIYVIFYLGIAFVPFVGIRLSLSTGSVLLGERAFGGSIDVSVAEIVLFFVLVAWAMKLLTLWRRRRDENWHPQLLLMWPYAVLFLAHVASAWSPLLPDPILVLKNAFRPVLFCYLAYILLPINLLRSRRRLIAALGTVALIGTLAAVNGLFSIFFSSSGAWLSRAHPLAIFGVSALGENHNELADILVWTVPMTLALAQLVQRGAGRRELRFAALFQFLIGLLTFTRTIWIAFALQGLILALTIWREAIKRYMSFLLVTGVILFPLGIGMLAYSVSSTAQSSNSTRLMLSQIAWELFVSSPWVGSGAGTFVDRVGSTRVFLLEYGDPLDSHGILQKVGAESGMFGLLGLALVVMAAGRFLLTNLRRVTRPDWYAAALLMIVAAAGSWFYQLFNTYYWTGKMWLPLGLALAAVQILREQDFAV